MIGKKNLTAILISTMLATNSLSAADSSSDGSDTTLSSDVGSSSGPSNLRGRESLRQTGAMNISHHDNLSHLLQTQMYDTLELIGTVLKVDQRMKDILRYDEIQDVINQIDGAFGAYTQSRLTAYTEFVRFCRENRDQLQAIFSAVPVNDLLEARADVRRPDIVNYFFKNSGSHEALTLPQQQLLAQFIGAIQRYQGNSSGIANTVYQTLSRLFSIIFQRLEDHHFISKNFLANPKLIDDLGAIFKSMRNSQAQLLELSTLTPEYLQNNIDDMHLNNPTVTEAEVAAVVSSDNLALLDSVKRFQRSMSHLIDLIPAEEVSSSSSSQVPPPRPPRGIKKQENRTDSKVALLRERYNRLAERSKRDVAAQTHRRLPQVDLVPADEVASSSSSQVPPPRPPRAIKQENRNESNVGLLRQHFDRLAESQKRDAAGQTYRGLPQGATRGNLNAPSQ